MILSNTRMFSLGGRMLNSISRPPYSGATLTNTVGVSLEVVNKTIPGWHVWVQGQPHNAMLNSSGVATTLSLQDISGTYAADDDALGYPNPENAEFPNAVLQTMIYLEAGTTKVFRLDGCNVARTYNFKFAVWGAYNEPYTDSKTNVTVNGVTQLIPVANGQVLYTTEFTGIVPNASGQILITLAGATGTDFPGLNAFIIKEYSA